LSLKDLNTLIFYPKRSLQGLEESNIGNTYDNRYLDWQEEGIHIQKLLREYNWNYRKKICSKCPVDTQRKLKCIQVDNSRDGIQETYCKKMTKARSQKFRKTILNYMEFHPSHNRL